ncbi:MAG: amidohydrolase family protein [Flavobacteriales bacterium]|nr:amidohydrolase family protein [Flavobacteriales bacterium]MCW8912452.1 amidohydrolase family protein [Flavobacteriales bacterium]MCW8936536.1 amidohydrolase family protein [Flavobacteriales bacterium]MCW8940851.1 amidohydrolase family protein [Flavobacteriales bacterium]MCW8968029.1 amidohydrolase family protein [Flavobacteriales bacterium]
MHKITADYIFTGNAEPIKNGIILIKNDGTIVDVINPKNSTINFDDVKKYEGVICPGFINTHCHLELSYLKNKITQKTTLPGFVKELVQKRNNFSEEERQIAINKAEQEMIKNGIVAVGDIANGNSTFQLKAKQNIYYHTFLEVFEIADELAKSAFNKVAELKATYFNNKQISIVPHAPYSVSKSLIKLIANQKDVLLSIHNQETESEKPFFKEKSGKLYEQMATFNPKVATWGNKKDGSLAHYLPYFKNTASLLLVHNTYTTKDDIAYAKQQNISIYWCFCPKANLYIENTLPDFTLFENENCTIGTDSLASNDTLSVLEELKVITENSNISLEKLIQWATYNGAKYLNINKQFGSIAKEKKPGINLLTNINLEELKLTQNTSVVKLY